MAERLVAGGDGGRRAFRLQRRPLPTDGTTPDTGLDAERRSQPSRLTVTVPETALWASSGDALFSTATLPYVERVQ